MLNKLNILKKVSYILFFLNLSIFSRDILVEFKGAGFVPTDCTVRDIYGHGAALFGPEATVQLCHNKRWYGFANIDFLTKRGHSIGLCEPTRMQLVPLAFGIKYFTPFCYGDFYLGLGFQAANLITINCSNFVAQNTSKWGFGGIAKLGAYIDLPRCFFIDLFIDYSFVKIKCDRCSDSVVLPKVNLSGVILGAGLGYRFN